MSTRNSKPVTLGTAAADLRAKEFAFGTFNGGNPVACGAGARADYIFANAANAGEAVEGFIGEIVLVKVGATPVLKHAALTPDGSGLAITATPGDVVRCKALEDGAAGQVIRALWVSAYELGT